MLTAIRRLSWNDSIASAASQPDVVLDSVSVKEDDPQEPIDPKEERGNRLFQDLMDGTTECPICAEEIDAEGSMWSCRECYHIYHFDCIKRWAENYQHVISWLCPTCKDAQYGSARTMRASCWCGRELYANISNRGNTCGATCLRPTRCDFNPAFPCRGSCNKPCHPGPCEAPACEVDCPSIQGVGRTPKLAGLSPVQYYRGMNRIEREQTANANAATPAAAPVPQQQPRRRERQDPMSAGSNFCGALTFFIFMMLLQSPFLYWQFSRIDRWTKPLKYMDFTENKRSVENGFSIFAAVVCAVFFGFFSSGIGHFLYEGFKLAFKVKNECTKILMSLVLICLCSPLGFTVLIIYLSGPGAAWDHQMKNSCNGFDSMIKLDGYMDYKTPSGYYPKTKISIRDPDFPQNNIPGINEFEFSNLTEASLQPTEAFYTYHRMTGTLSPSTHMAVDFDLAHQQWRITHLTNNDSTSNPPTIPPNAITSTSFRNGTWTTTKSSPHVFIPELNLHIPNMHYFTQNCVYQAFMKVYNTTWNSELEIEEQAKREWSDKNEPEVVMRTAAFGSSPDGLEVCARRENYVVEDGGELLIGLGENVVVPLGLMAVLRLQMESEGKLKSGCRWVYT